MGQLGTKIKQKDVSVTVPANTTMYTFSTDAKQIIAATNLYTDGTYYLKPVLSVSNASIIFVCNAYQNAQILITRILYID